MGNTQSNKSKKSAHPQKKLEYFADDALHGIENNQFVKRWNISLTVTDDVAPDEPEADTNTQIKQEFSPFVVDDKYYNNSDNQSISESSSLDMIEGLPQSTPISCQKGALLGSGAFGKVYLGFDTQNGQLLAVKQIEALVNNEEHKENLEELLIEINLMRSFNHKNIVKYHGAAQEGSFINIYLEYVPGGSISSLLQKFGSFSQRVVSTYTHQILKGLNYLHRKRIIHRDIKGANILVATTGEVKLADFGTAKRIQQVINSTTPSLRGTPYFMAPEIIKQENIGRHVDIWSLGCTVYEMITGRPPYSEINEPIAVMWKIVEGDTPTLPTNIHETCSDFLSKCLMKEPSERPNAFSLMSHPFILYPPEPNNSAPSIEELHQINSYIEESEKRFSENFLKEQ